MEVVVNLYLKERKDITLDSPVFVMAHKSLCNLYQRVTKLAEVECVKSGFTSGYNTSYHKAFRRRFYEVGLDCKVDDVILRHLLGEEKLGFDMKIPDIRDLTLGYTRMMGSLDIDRKASIVLSQ